MKWSDLPRNPSAKTLRQFAGAWLVFCLAGAAYQWLAKGRPQLAAVLVVLAALIGLPGLIRPMVVRWLFVGWMILAFPIGWLVSQLMLLVMYFFILTPVALVFRITGRDALARQRDRGASTYWVEKKIPADSRRYFRQY